MSKLQLHRIRPSLRPLRPPRPRTRSSELRQFTQNVQLLLISSGAPRPQLPFLHPPSARLPAHTRLGQLRRARLLTTEQKRYIKEQVWLAGKYTVYGWTMLGLLAIMALGVNFELLERKFPSPPEWWYWSRMHYNHARGLEDAESQPTGVVEWSAVASTYRDLLQRLEDPDVDGKDLQEQSAADGSTIAIADADAGPAGFDLSRKSYPWRRGYYEVLMGYARALQHVDGWVRDKTRGFVFPPDVVIGPSNPRPRPSPPGAHPAPLEQNCEVAYDSPEVYYTRLLTTRGFSPKERLDAALAYADWLDYKGLHAAAEETYRWGLDIACAALPEPDSVVDRRTGTIRGDAPGVSQNVLEAATALGIHHATHANVSKALPIFLSVLRARRAAQEATAPLSSTSSSPSKPPSFLSTALSFLRPPAYPDPPPSGDTAFVRTAAAACEDAILMTYVGEILFASSDRAEEGLGWTRDAVDIAEAQCRSREAGLTQKERERCRECLDMGLDNWRQMVGRLAGEEKVRREGGVVGGKKGSWSWLWNREGRVDGDGGERRWEREREAVAQRTMKVKTELLRDNLAKEHSNEGAGLMLGAA